MKKTRLKRKTPLRKKSKQPRKKVIAEMDKIVSEYVRLRDGRCVVCGSTEKLGCGHLLSRRLLATRWDICADGNCHTQCWPCNFKHTMDPHQYRSWYVRQFGLEAFEEMYARAHAGVYWGVVALRDMRDALREKLAEAERSVPRGDGRRVRRATAAAK